MIAANALWVLGHKIRVLPTDDSYGLVEITTPAGVPGPPPHFHKADREFFMIIQGALDVMRDGQWSRMNPGAFVELPANTVHTFANKTEQDVVWITGWRPKGFERFFSDFGVAEGEQDARGKSVAEGVIRRVMEGCERYGMHLKV
jgi:quercetin dioxygenase-like cupin family protein